MDFRLEAFDEPTSNLIQLLNRDILTDLEICTDDGVNATVHSVVLGTLGDKFYKKISSDIEHKSLTSTKKLKLKQTNRDVLKVLINYAYKDVIDLEPLTVWKVLEFAKLYQMDSLLEECFNFLINRINVLNCMKIFFESSKINESIRNKVKLFFKKNLVEISNSNSDFVNIDHETLFDLLDDDYLNIKQESQVWEVISKWIHFNPKERQDHLCSLLKTIRYGRLEKDYIKNTIATDSIMKLNGNYVKLVNDIMSEYDKLTNHGRDGYNLLANKDIRSIRPRIPRKIIFMYGGWKNGITTESVEVYDSQTNIWFETNMVNRIQRSYHGMELLNDKIYIIGGTDGNDVKNTFIRFDPVRRTCKKLAPMLEPRCYVSTTSLNESIYAIGGHNGEQRTDSCEKYILTRNMWVKIANMNVVRSDACAVAYKNKIYVAGGLNPNNVENSVEVYDPQNDVWTLIEQMTSPRTSFSLTCYNNRLYALGGNDGYERLSTAECYDFRLKMWTPIEEMACRRSTFKATVFNNELYAVGGYNGMAPIKNAEKYNDVTKKWTEIKSINHDRSGFGILAMDLENSKIYTFNGK